MSTRVEIVLRAGASEQAHDKLWEKLNNLLYEYAGPGNFLIRMDAPIGSAKSESPDAGATVTVMREGFNTNGYFMDPVVLECSPNVSLTREMCIVATALAYDRNQLRTGDRVLLVGDKTARMIDTPMIGGLVRPKK